MVRHEFPFVNAIYWLTATDCFGVPSIYAKHKLEHRSWCFIFTKRIPIIVDNLNNNLSSGVGDYQGNIEIIVEFLLVESLTPRNDIRIRSWHPWWLKSHWFTTMSVDVKVFVNASTKRIFVMYLGVGRHIFGGTDMPLIVDAKGEEIDLILLGRLLLSWRLNLVLSFIGERLVKVVTELSLEILIICRLLVFKTAVSVLMVEVIYWLVLPQTLGILQVVIKLLQLKIE